MAAKRKDSKQPLGPNEVDLFRESMRNVTPLKSEPPAPGRRGPPARKAINLQHRQAPAGIVRLDGDLFYRPGVSAAVLTDLKKGRLRPTATIDLHGSSANEAAVRLQRFIDSRANVAPQCLLVITGRGSHSPGGHSVIREQTLEQLRCHLAVQAYTCSRPADGGSGAFYVLVRSGRLD